MTQASLFYERNTALKELKQEMMKRAVDGVRCPCCGQMVKIYRRKLNAPMAYFLVWLVKQYLVTQDWTDVPKDGPMIQGRRGGGDFAKLEHWAMIEQKVCEDQKKRTSGFWRPTTKGMKFVAAKLKVPAHVFLMFNRVKGFSDDRMDIAQALAAGGFDYQELWNGGQ